MTKKLFAVEITYKAYAWVENSYEAEEMAREIVSTEDFPEILITEPTSNILAWDPKCCVYHNDKGDIMLRDVLANSQKPLKENAELDPQAPAPAGGLVERVAIAILDGMVSSDHQAARAAILAVAEWFDAIGYGATASILRQEVERG